MLLFYIKKEDTSGSDLTAESVPLGNTEEVSFNNIISQDNDIVNNSIHNNTENDSTFFYWHYCFSIVSC